MKIDKKTIDQIKPWGILALFCTLLVYILLHISEIGGIFAKIMHLCISLFYAIGIAYVLNLPMSRFELLLKKKIKPTSKLYKRIRGISIGLTVILSLLLVVVLLSIIIPQLVSSAVMLTNNLVVYAQNIINFVNDILEKINLEEALIDFDPQALNKYIQSITSNWEGMLKSASGWVGNASTMILNNALALTAELGNWFMGFMLSLYLLSSKEVFICQIRKIIAAIFPYNATKKIFEIASKSNDIFSSFISGQLVEACILGLLIYTGMRICHLGANFEILISVVVAVTSIIPMFGAMFAMAFGFILILATDPIQAVLFVIFFQVVQQFEGNVIYPRVVGKSVGLPAIWVLLSIVVFGGLFGIVGMLVAVPSTAVLYSLSRELVNWCLKQKNIVVTTTTFVDYDEVVEDNNEHSGQ